MCGTASMVTRFVFELMGTNAYVVSAGDEVIVVDPHRNPKMMNCLRVRRPSRVVVLLTHEHPDHTFGVPDIAREFECRLICQRRCAEAIADMRNNRPLLMGLVLAGRKDLGEFGGLQDFLLSFPRYALHADEVFDDRLSCVVGGRRLEFVAAPGHSPGGCLITMDGECVFTGDNLIPGVPPILRFPGGSRKDFEEVTQRLLDAIPDDMLVLPGHGNPFAKKDAPVRGPAAAAAPYF